MKAVRFHVGENDIYAYLVPDFSRVVFHRKNPVSRFPRPENWYWRLLNHAEITEYETAEGSFSTMKDLWRFINSVSDFDKPKFKDFPNSPNQLGVSFGPKNITNTKSLF